MRTLIALIAAATLTGCATRHAVSHIQDYRPKGQDEKMSIQGAIQVDPGAFSNDYNLLVRIDNVTRISLNLGTHGNGEITCKAGQDDQYCKAPPEYSLGATCNSSTRNSTVSTINCIVFVNDERAATFKFN